MSLHLFYMKYSEWSLYMTCCTVSISLRVKKVYFILFPSHFGQRVKRTSSQVNILRTLCCLVLKHRAPEASRSRNTERRDQAPEASRPSEFGDAW